MCSVQGFKTQIHRKYTFLSASTIICTQPCGKDRFCFYATVFHVVYTTAASLHNSFILYPTVLCCRFWVQSYVHSHMVKTTHNCVVKTVFVFTQQFHTSPNNFVLPLKNVTYLYSVIDSTLVYSIRKFVYLDEKFIEFIWNTLMFIHQ